MNASAIIRFCLRCFISFLRRSDSSSDCFFIDSTFEIVKPVFSTAAKTAGDRSVSLRTVSRSVDRFTLAASTPCTLRTARSTDAEQAAQVMPPIEYSLIMKTHPYIVYKSSPILQHYSLLRKHCL